MEPDDTLTLLNLLKNSRSASLASINPGDGAPFVSLVNFALTADGLPLLLLSDLAWHTRNLRNDPRGSLLLVDNKTDGDPLTGLRITVMGSFVLLAKEALREVYLRQHPAAAGYFDFSDFGLWQMMPETVHQVAGFGRIKTFAAREIFDGYHRE